MIKEISVEVKKSYNFQTYGASEVLSVDLDPRKPEDKELLDDIKTAAYNRCRISVMEQIKADKEVKV